MLRIQVFLNATDSFSQLASMLASRTQSFSSYRLGIGKGHHLGLCQKHLYVTYMAVLDLDMQKSVDSLEGLSGSLEHPDVTVTR